MKSKNYSEMPLASLHKPTPPLQHAQKTQHFHKGLRSIY